jgi:hypothetical protein
MQGVPADCPHCGTRRAFFGFKAEVKSKKLPLWYVLAVCQVCDGAVILEFSHRGASLGDSPNKAAEHGDINDQFHLGRMLPEAPRPRLATHIPENVESPLLEAEQAYANCSYSAAGSMYRKATERAVKAIDPELTGMLNTRIRKLEERSLLPNAMIELLDQVRLFGNASMHEDEIDPTEEECSAARDFCHLFLTYTFSLPAKVAEAKENADKSSLA